MDGPFAESARSLIARASELARRMGQLEVTPQHLLLSEERLGATDFLLPRQRARLQELKRLATCAPTPTPRASGQDIVFSEATRKVFMAAYGQARALGHTALLEDHLLLALLPEAGAERPPRASEVPVLELLEGSLTALAKREGIEASLLQRRLAHLQVAQSKVDLKRLVPLAFIQARALGYSRLSDELMLLAILLDGSPVAEVLSELGLSETVVRDGMGPADPSPPPDWVTFMPDPAADSPALLALGERAAQLTEEGRKAIFAAWEIARRQESPEVNTEHVLVGIFWTATALWSESNVLQVLADQGALRGLAYELPTYVKGSDVPDFNPPLSAQARRAVDLIELHRVDSESLLLALMRLGEGEAHRLLAAHGATVAGIEASLNAR